MRGTNARKLLVQPRPIKGANYPKTFVVVYFYRLSIDFYKFLEPGLLSSYGKSNNSKFGKTLFLKYRINRKGEDSKDLSEEDKAFIYSLNEKIDTSHYFSTFFNIFNCVFII